MPLDRTPLAGLLVQPTEPFELNASDLISGAGDRIAASQVKFTPRSLKIRPASTAKLTPLTARIFP